MALKDRLVSSGRRGVQDLLAVELDPDATRCVRFKRVGDSLTVPVVQVLPPVDLSEKVLQNVESLPALNLPKPLAARSVAVALPGADALVKLLNLPGQVGDDVAALL